MAHPEPQLRLLSSEDGEPQSPQTDDHDQPFEDLFRRYAPYVGRIGLSILGNHDEVDDLVQDVFMLAFRKRRGLRDPDAVKGWLATIAVREAGRQLKRRRGKRIVGLHADAREAPDLADNTGSPEERAILVALYRELDKLPVAERVAWTLRRVEEEKLEVVARLTQCSLATAKRRIAAAQARLKEVLGGR